MLHPLRLRESGSVPVREVISDWPDVRRRYLLTAQTELLNYRLIPLGLVLPQVIQQPAPLADQCDQPSPRGVVLDMGLEMVGQVGNPLAEDRNLDLRRTRVLSVDAVALYRSCFGCQLNRTHTVSSLSSSNVLFCLRYSVP